MPRTAKPVDAVFRALADPTRRRVIERLSRGPASVGELAKPFGMKLPSFMQHLRELESARLVESKKTGRVRTYRLAPQKLKLTEAWLARQRSRWERRLDDIDNLLLILKGKQK